MFYLNKFFIIVIKAYQAALSPILGGQCRFVPSCSDYAIYQFTHRSFWAALTKTLWRILRCNPFSKGGYDLD
ncbi:MAG: membrane protein insertion efficiency factor YidD [Candidatus Delongbacteria bacterium]|nr:membrane protein insertion efficiency factor YidD [Candidatus Delongbacteria bacterium]